MRIRCLVALMALANCTAEPVNPPSLDSGTRSDASAQRDSGSIAFDSGSSSLDIGPFDSGTTIITGDAGSLGCEGDNPAQCTSDEECPGEQICDRSGCRPSHCDCVNGEWRCTPDCGGGVCLEPDPSGCPGENPQGCQSDADCGEGFACNSDACAPSICTCAGGNAWTCTFDCGGGRCLAIEGFCQGVPAPSGCSQFACPDGQRCVVPVGGCAGSSCFCEQEGWICSEDCGGGGECQPL